MNRNKKKEIESEIIKRLVAEFVMSGGKITQVADGVISAPMFPSHNNQLFKTNKVNDDRKEHQMKGFDAALAQWEADQDRLPGGPNSEEYVEEYVEEYGEEE